MILVFVVIYFPIVFSFIGADKGDVVCGKIECIIQDSVENQFITPDEIKAIALKKYTGVLGGKLQDVNCDDMETFFRKHPAIEACEVYYSFGGTLHIDVWQREPLIRVFDGNTSYYLDAQGKKMPLFKNHTAHALVAGGHIKRLPALDDLVTMAVLINADRFWKAQIEQVYVDKKGEFILVPRVGDHLVEFGSVRDLDVKFRKLKALYKSGWDTREWNLYKKVNLKYKGQVVCTKG